MINKKKGVMKRYEVSYQSKESGAPTKAGVMDWKKVDEEINFFSPQEGRNRINIIPYTIKTRNHPLVRRGEWDIGCKDYVMDIFVHRGVGPSEANVLCLKSNYGKPCPICEQSELLKKQGKEKESKELKPTRRVFYNIQDLKEPDKLKVFETSHFLFEKELIDEARDDDEGGFVDFADEEAGKEIKFRCSKVSKSRYEFNEFKSFSFEDREKNIPDELLESAISFDEIMNVPTYEESEKILFGQDEDDDEEQEDEKSTKKCCHNLDDEEKPAESTKKHLTEEEDDEEPEDNESIKPTKKIAKQTMEDEEPSKKSSNGNCPFNHCFGKDCENYDDCDDCDCWDKCVKEK